MKTSPVCEGQSFLRNNILLLLRSILTHPALELFLLLPTAAERGVWAQGFPYALSSNLINVEDTPLLTLLIADLYMRVTSELPQTEEITGYSGPFNPEKAGPK